MSGKRIEQFSPEPFRVGRDRWLTAGIAAGLAVACLLIFPAVARAQAPLVPAPQPRAAAPAEVEQKAKVPRRSRHGNRRQTRPRVRTTPWGVIPGRPATVEMAAFGFAWPAAWGHPSRPIVSPMAALNVVRDPYFTPYVPGRPIASPMARMSLLTPHYVVRMPPQQLWIGGGRLRTARADNAQSNR